MNIQEKVKSKRQWRYIRAMRSQHPNAKKQWFWKDDWFKNVDYKKLPENEERIRYQKRFEFVKDDRAKEAARKYIDKYADEGTLEALDSGKIAFIVEYDDSDFLEKSLRGHPDAPVRRADKGLCITGVDWTAGGSRKEKQNLVFNKIKQAIKLLYPKIRF